MKTLVQYSGVFFILAAVVILGYTVLQGMNNNTNLAISIVLMLVGFALTIIINRKFI